MKLREVEVDAIRATSLDDISAIEMFLGADATVVRADGHMFHRSSDEVLLVYAKGDITSLELGDWLIRLGNKLVGLSDEDFRQITKG